jgi:hypothetical protein
MSFKCDVCKKPQDNGVKGTKIVTEIRNITYPTVRDKFGKIKTPTGYETVKEVYACSECSKKDFNVAVVGSKVIEGKKEEEKFSYAE